MAVAGQTLLRVTSVAVAPSTSYPVRHRSMIEILLFGLLLSQSIPPSCDRGPAARALDFWIGDWRVQNEAGREVGRSEVTYVAGGCAVLERFRGVDGEGASLATYSVSLQRWERLFTNTGGLLVRQEGTPVSGGVRFLGTAFRPDGTREQMRTTFLRETVLPENPGRVRQTVELSSDGGRTWRRLGVALYVRP